MKHLIIHNSDPSPELSIVIPAYKEESTIGPTLEKLSAHLKSRNYPTVEVLVSVGKSPDKTFEKAMEKSFLFENFSIINEVTPHQKGDVVHAGMMKARGEMCVYMDADLATPLHHLDKTLELLKEHDVVNGQRNISTIHKGHRKFISLFGNFLVRKILLPGYKDTQCGFKGFRRSAAKELFGKQKVSAWGFDMEILALARNMNYHIAQLPIPDWKDIEGGSLNAGPTKAFKAAIYTFYDLLRIRFYLATGHYYSERKA